ncbi:hypothetical protein [Flavobacterium sp.]
MAVGYVILPFVILIFYIIPIGLFFNKSIRKSTRLFLLSIPILLTVILTTYTIIDNNDTEELLLRFPQTNKITFSNSTKDIRDSIIQLQRIMQKLPKRSDHQSVSYVLDKHPQRYYSFSFNWYRIGNLKNLENDHKLHDFKIGKEDAIDWNKYVNKDLTPFDTLNPNECLRFINIIKFLDKNNLNAANLEDNIISFDYNDSLRISDNMGFRKITLDTTGYYGAGFFEIIDRKDGFYLLRKK